ncbi:MAG: DUF2752 domain-containing protein [Eubacteriales bacterium]|nr:DUF2752 domain-containing protein [Eubacteriales bacterium]
MKNNNLFRKLWRQLLEDSLIFAAFLCFFLLTNAVFGSVCPIAALFGIPCPGCGMTRAGLLLLTGHPVSALKMHPLIYLWIPYVLFFFYDRYAKIVQTCEKNKGSFVKRSRLLKIGLYFLLVCMMLLYLLRFLLHCPVRVLSRGLFPVLYQSLK